MSRRELTVPCRMLAVSLEAYLMERCWQGKFAGMARCHELGRYGNPDAPVKFMRAARWCFAHRHADDRLLEPNEGEKDPGRDRTLTDDICAS
jgi:hypothetical protein